MKHLIFYDGTCGLCHEAVQFILKHDKNKVFMFAPLQGETAAKLLKNWRATSPSADSLVLIENYEIGQSEEILTFGIGALRICWLLGGLWKTVGVISFLPSFLYDWVYKLIAKRRFKWFESKTCLIPKIDETERFLP